MQKYNLKLIRDDTNYVSSFVNGVEYKISKILDRKLIIKSKQLDKKCSINREYYLGGQLQYPRIFIYNLWIHIYQLSEYNCYYDPLNYMIAESKRKLKFYQWRAKWKRKLLLFLQL